MRAICVTLMRTICVTLMRAICVTLMRAICVTLMRAICTVLARHNRQPTYEIPEHRNFAIALTPSYLETRLA